MLYSTTVENLCQSVDLDALEPLSDVGRAGKERPWREYKMANETLAVAYDTVDPRKAERLRQCGKVLTFLEDAAGNKRLQSADSCRVRLCPLCSWRRSLKNFWNTMRILQYFAASGKKYAYIFLTLTVRNCSGDELSRQLNDMFAAIQRLTERAEVRRAFRGMVRNLEVTHNVCKESKDYDTYHPHFHCIVAVNPSYFTSRDYLSQARLTELWQEAIRADYVPVIDVRRVKGVDARAVAECSKYAAKAQDYIIHEDWPLTIQTVRLLDSALANRRLINYSGVFRAAKSELRLEDAETGSLDDVGALDDVELGENKRLVSYYWYSGYRQYYKV